jgi:hypothetical protein
MLVTVLGNVLVANWQGLLGLHAENEKRESQSYKTRLERRRAATRSYLLEALVEQLKPFVESEPGITVRDALKLRPLGLLRSSRHDALRTWVREVTAAGR